MKRYFKTGSILLSIALLAIFMAQVDFILLWEKLRLLKWKFLFIILTPGLGYWLATLAWRHCFPQGKVQPSLYRLFMIRHLGESLALINPTNIIAGESSKAVLLHKEGVPYKTGIVSLVLSRTLLILSHILLLVVLCLYLFYTSEMPPSLWLQVGLLALSLALSIVFFHTITHRKLWLYRAYCQLAKRLTFLGKSNQKIKQINREMSRFYREQQSHLFWAFGYSALHWCIGALEFYLIFWFLEVPIGYEQALFIELGVMIFKSLGSFVPGQIGVEEYGNLFMLNLLSYQSSELWLAISLIRRGRQVFWLIISVFIGWSFFRKSKGKIVLHKPLSHQFSKT